MHPLFTTVALLGTLAGAGASPAAPPDRVRILVMPLKATGVPDDAAKQAAGFAADAVAARGGYAVLTLEDIQQVASHEKMKAMMGCESNLGCLAELSSGIGADLVVTGSVGKVGRQVTVNLALVEVKTSSVLNRVGTTAEDLGGLRTAVTRAVEELMRKVAAPGAPPPPAVAAAAKPRLLVMPLHATAEQEAVARQVQAFLADGIGARGAHAVVSLEELQQAAGHEQLRALLGCENNTGCLAELSRGVNVDLVVSGSLGRVGKQWTLNVSLLDARSATVLQRAGSGADEPAGLRAAAASVVDALLGGPAAAGSAYKLPTGRSVSLAVMDLAAVGVDPNLAQNLTQVLSSEIKRVDGTSVISRDDIQAILQMQEQKALAGCDDASCLAEIGGALGVEKLVVGSVGRVADTHTVSLRIISVKDTLVENRITESFRGPDEQLIRAVKQASRKLLGVEAARPGALAVSCNQDGAEVLVDGNRAGAVPLQPLKALVPGMHRVEVRKGGFHAWSGEVFVEPDETTAVWASLEAIPARWYQKWWVWTLIGTGAAAGTLAALGMAGAATVGGVGAAGVLTSRKPDTGRVDATIAE